MTTSRSLLSLDIRTRILTPLHRGLGLYYGIARAQSGDYFIAARGRTPSSAVKIDDERGQVLVSTDLTTFRTLDVPFPLRDMHGMLAEGDNLYITCSRDNFVAVRRDDGWSRWHPQLDDCEGGADVHHYNTIALLDGLLWLVAHNHGDSELLAFSPSSLCLVRRVALGNIAHNVWIEDGQLFTCSSGDQSVLGDKGFHKYIGGFIRGYLRLPDGRRIVGINEYAPRSRRDQTASQLAIFSDRWNEEFRIQLDGEGMVLDILMR